jgi:peptidoglycan biosynthesis protein MviN/MurJ (putative lipid II flippase)
VVRSELSLAILAALNIVLAFLSQIVVFAVIGPGGETDALVASTTIPTIVTTVLAVALPAVLVPRLAGEPAEQQASEGAAAMLAIAIIVGTLAAFFLLSSAWWVKLLFGGFSEPLSELCAHLLRIQALGMVFTAASTVATAVLAARSKFLTAEALAAATALLGLLGLYALLPRFGVDAAAWVAVARSALLLLLVLPLLGRPVLSQSAWHAQRGTWRALKPLILGNAYYKSEILVDRFLLSMAARGDLSLYGVAQQVHSAGSAVIGKVWGTVAVTRLAEYAKAGDRAGFLRLYRRNTVVLFALPAAAWVLLLLIGGPLLQLAIGHGKITDQNVQLLWWFMVLLGGIVLGGSVGTLLGGAFYALGDTRTPTWMSIITFTLFLGVKYAAFTGYGVEGLCYAASAYYLLNAMLLAVLFPRVLNERLPG